jgi:hypothetical protein
LIDVVVIFCAEPAPVHAGQELTAYWAVTELAAIHDYMPELPWGLYCLTESVIQSKIVNFGK